MLDPSYIPKSWGRSGHRWRVVRQQAFERDKKANAPCWICVEKGKPPEECAINYAAPATDPWSWQPDHVLPVKEYPQFALDIANLRASHARCNNQRGQEDKKRRKQAQELGEPSEDWGI